MTATGNSCNRHSQQSPAQYLLLRKKNSPPEALMLAHALHATSVSTLKVQPCYAPSWVRDFGSNAAGLGLMLRARPNQQRITRRAAQIFTLQLVPKQPKPNKKPKTLDFSFG
jgi:hypothetical protein